MKRRLLAFTLALLALAFVGWNLRRNQPPAGAVRADEVPLKGFEAKTLDATKTGDPDAAMQHLHQLMAALRANNWDANPKKVPLALQTLPDAKFAENPADRNGECIFLPNQPDTPKDHYIPEFEPIAFYTRIYARYNRAYYKGDRSQSHPTGYVIVGWKDGRIEKIPVTQVRQFRSSNSSIPGELDCYPGMAVYDTAKSDSMLSDAASK